jgi:hypothetical protein
MSSYLDSNIPTHPITNQEEKGPTNNLPGCQPTSTRQKTIVMLDIILLVLALTLPTTSLPPPLRTLLSPSQQQGQQQPILPSPNKIDQTLTTQFRPAIESDLPAITTITVEAFSPSAAWHYLIPDIESHKKEIWNCMHDQIVSGWAHFDRTNNFLNVITVPSSNNAEDDNKNQEGKETSEIPVSFAVWNMRTASNLSPFSLPSILQTCLTPPGTNLTRALDLHRQIQAVEQKYFSPSEEGSVWQDQMYLNLLATHPDWDGNGFAARQVRWGMELSRGIEDLEMDEGKEMGGTGDGGEAKGTVPVTLLATPAGWPLYESLGFEGVENATIDMLDGLGGLWFEVCKWDG